MVVVQPALGCKEPGVWVQVLGSGGPELDDERASSGYLVWQDGKARILVDMGAGSLLRFEQAGADLNDIDAILMTHFHVDHSNDLPALIKASYFTGRQRDLPVYGPTGNSLMPSTREYLQGLFGEDGAFRYLKSYIEGSDDYRVIGHDIDAQNDEVAQLAGSAGHNITTVPVNHGPIPALAWRVEIAGRSIVFSGDMSNHTNRLASLARGADLLVAHHAIPEQASQAARRLHMPPSEIGKIAGAAAIKQLVLSHRMQRTMGNEKQSQDLINENYRGPVHFANDLQCFKP